MTTTRFDQAARRVARLDPAGFLAWLLTGFEESLRFRRWLDTRTTPRPEDPELTGDTVAELEALGAAPPWLFPVEFQTEPDPDMFGGLLCQGGQLWQDQRPDPLAGSRYQLAMAVVNLTGTRQSAPASRRYQLPCQDDVLCALKVRERHLAEESAAELLERVGREEVSRGLLPFVPLMQGGGDSGIIERWLGLAGQEPDPHRRGDLATLALVLAELKDWYPAWDPKRKESNVRESVNVLRWKREAEVEALRRTLRAVLERRFGPLSEDTIQRVEASADADKLHRAVVQAVDVSRPEDLSL
jgi:hypothetical protein